MQFHGAAMIQPIKRASLEARLSQEFVKPVSMGMVARSGDLERLACIVETMFPRVGGQVMALGGSISTTGWFAGEAVTIAVHP